MPVGVITTFLQLSGMNPIGAEGGTFRSCFLYISLTVSNASLSCIAAGAALNCNTDSIRGAYLRSVLYFSVIRCNGSKLSLRDRNRVSSTLLMNSCQGRTSSIDPGYSFSCLRVRVSGVGSGERKVQCRQGVPATQSHLTGRYVAGHFYH